MTTPATTPADGLAVADALEAEYLAVANGTKKPGKMDLEPLVRAVQALRALATPSPGKAPFDYDAADDSQLYALHVKGNHSDYWVLGKGWPGSWMTRDDAGWCGPQRYVVEAIPLIDRIESVHFSSDGPAASPGKADAEQGSRLPEIIASQDDFEAWCLRNGLKTDRCITSRNGMFPCTYYEDNTEFAWRAWANKPGKADAGDAARYRRIRNGPHSDRHGDVYAMVFMPDGDAPIHGAKLDSIIDAALQQERDK